MATPATAAAWASAATEACGLASQPNTSAWTKAAPVSFERRCTKPVARAAASAVVVNTVCRVWASCGTVVIRRLLRRYKVSHILIVPKDLSDVFVTLMRKRERRRHPPRSDGPGSHEWWLADRARSLG